MMEIKANGPYSFKETLAHMSKQDDCLYTVTDDAIYKAEWFHGRKVLMKLTGGAEDTLNVSIVSGKADLEEVRSYCSEWLDLDYDLNEFYEFAGQDPRLRRAVNKHHGYRMTGKVDITEAFLWAILGQQITMSFAHVLKGRVVRHCNHYIEYEGMKFYLMPSAGEIAEVGSGVLRDMQISTRKTEYIKDVMKSVEAGELSKPHLQSFDDYDDVFKHLTSFRGIGPWSANTVLMRTLKYRNAVPVGDAGIKNAVKLTDGLSHAPSKEYIGKVTDEWGGFGMYGTLYMWEML